MFRRLIISTTLALFGAFSAIGVAQASKGPHAGEVSIGTILVVLGVMAFLSLVYGLKGALGAARALPPEQPPAEEHH